MSVAGTAAPGLGAPRTAAPGRVRRVLVTGASRGIGRAIAEALLDAGHRVALCGRDAAALEVITTGRPFAEPLVADLADPAQLDGVVPRALELLGGLDVLINCAGIVSYQAVGELTREALEAQLAVDLIAPVLLTQAAIEPLSQAPGGGVVIQIASTLGLKPAPLTAGYAAAKAALISMTRSFARELGPLGIRVNAVAPGITDTDMVRGRELEALARQHPLGRIAQPADVVPSVLYLMDAEFVTGAVLAVDGGLLLVS
jgi:NAD(P)-dependent dehydrogenase (short-subunit alcohol dehydrogenase family)